jgi:subtilisin family serine protease
MGARRSATPLTVVALSVAMGFAWLTSAMNDAAAQSSRTDVSPAPTTVAVITQAQPGWALDRIDQRRQPLDHKYRSRTRGRGVTVYVIDCGAQVGNPQFGSRARRGANIAGGHWSDCFDEMAVGHATFVSGIIGGVKTGVAKRSHIVSVRTLEGGEGAPTPPPRTQLRRVVRAIDWVIADAASRHRPAVVNMSLTFDGDHPRLTRAMTRLEEAGITAVVAAGNDGRNACRHTPAQVRSALTVGAVNRRDHVWSGSNQGPCVDLFAPGVSVRSVLNGGGVLRYRHSGATSWATPYVTGAVALYLSRHRHAAPTEVRRWIRKKATTGRLSGLSSSTANRLLYSFARLGR